MFSLSLDSLQKTAGWPREYLWKGRQNAEQAEGKGKNEKTTNAQARGGMVINNYDISIHLSCILGEEQM